MQSILLHLAVLLVSSFITTQITDRLFKAPGSTRVYYFAHFVIYHAVQWLVRKVTGIVTPWKISLILSLVSMVHGPTLFVWHRLSMVHVWHRQRATSRRWLWAPKSNRAVYYVGNHKRCSSHCYKHPH
jgi:hypothetical protein